MKALVLILSLFSLNAFSEAEVEANGVVTVHLEKACANSTGKKSCVYENDFRLVVSCSTSLGRSTHYGYMYCNNQGTMTIESNYPMSEIIARYEMRRGDKLGDYYTYEDSGTSHFTLRDGEEMKFSIRYSYDYSPILNMIKFKTGMASHLNGSLKNASGILKGSYAGVLRNLNDFETKIAKSHRSHLLRFKKALTDGISYLSEEQKDGSKKYSIVHHKVQENARLIVVFGTVLDELLEDYDDVGYLQVSIKSMRILVSQLRLSYGWEKNLAGNISKASDALLEVIGLELQELASIKMAFSQTGYEVYVKMIYHLKQLQAKIKTARSGDMKGQREIYALVDEWNSSAWQNEILDLLNAGPDFKNVVLPKLAMLIYAVESVEDLTEAGFVIPENNLRE